MTDCPNGDLRDLLPDLLHGRLDAVERARVEQHVATCEACSAELALLRELRSTIRRAPVVDTAAIAAAIPSYRAPARQRSWGSLRAAAAIAAIAVGGTSIALLARQSGREALPEQVAIAPHSESIPVVPRGVPESGARSVPADVRIAPTPRTDAIPSPTGTAPVGLAMTGGAIGELSDRELSTLLDEIESLDALPSEEIESGGAIGGSIPLETNL